MRGHLRGCESFNLGDLTGVQHARPHGEEARAARRLEPWRQVRTRGHPSRRPRHSASKTRVDALWARAPQDEVGVEKDSHARKPSFLAEFLAPGFSHSRARTEFKFNR